MIFRVSILVLLVALHAVTVSAVESKAKTELTQKTMGDAIESAVRSACRQVYDHPYLAALTLWCGVYRKTAVEKLISIGNNPWIFVPVVGTILFYLLHDQPEFGGLSESDHLEVNINLSNSKIDNHKK